MGEQNQHRTRGRATRPTQADQPTGGDRGLRGLTGSGPTQLDVDTAMRARDASRPEAADLADAETELQIVRRHWQPRDHR